jgi:DNA primase
VGINELRPNLKPETLNIKTVLTRLKRKGDLWSSFWKSRQRIENAVERLGSAAAIESPK